MTQTYSRVFPCLLQDAIEKKIRLSYIKDDDDLGKTEKKPSKQKTLLDDISLWKSFNSS